MKYIYITITILFTLSCKAQTIKPIYESGGYGKDGIYYKDTHNDFDRFVGTWKFTNGTTSLTVKFQKKIKKSAHNPFSNSNYFEDALVGEYQYIEGGIEKINTLSNLNIDYEDAYDYNITSGSIIKYGDRNCHDCDNPNQVKVRCSYSEPDCEIYGDDSTVMLRYFVENGVEKVQFNFISSGGLSIGLNGEPSPCDAYSLPNGGYTLIKQ